MCPGYTRAMENLVLVRRAGELTKPFKTSRLSLWLPDVPEKHHLSYFIKHKEFSSRVWGKKWQVVC